MSVQRWVAAAWMTGMAAAAMGAQGPGVRQGPSQTATSTVAQAATRTATLPPMGWNSWNHFAERVTDADIRAAADQMVSTGMRDAGYVYVNIDDTWQGKRDANGAIHPNERFPDMKALGDYIHAKGLKFGIYSSPGAQTCGGYAGSLGHEQQDARTYAAWGVDFLKYDLCSFADDMKAAEAAHPADPDAATQAMIAAYDRMGKALRETGRPIVYSLCQYGVAEPWKWGPRVGASMWRTTDDISDNFARMLLIGQSQAEIAAFNGPGHWNDPDMLEIGNGKMSTEEYRTHMALWSMLSAPLLAGNDLSRMSEADRAILTNRELIGIDQDPLAAPARRLWQRGDWSVWTRQLSGGRTALLVVSDFWGTRQLQLNLAELGITGAEAHDAWTGKAVTVARGRLALTVPGHGNALVLFRKADR